VTALQKIDHNILDDLHSVALTTSYILYKRRKKIIGKEENENGERVVRTVPMFVSYREDNNGLCVTLITSLTLIITMA
jgi:hypothetical protein